jgi:hypothetical protein
MAKQDPETQPKRARLFSGSAGDWKRFTTNGGARIIMRDTYTEALERIREYQ